MNRRSPHLLGDRFYDLLEACAEEAGDSVRLLGNLPGTPEGTEALAAVRHRSESLAAEIGAGLAKTIMASLQRDDIQGLAHALGVIPERAGRFAGRLLLARESRAEPDLRPCMEPLVAAGQTVVAMVRQLRAFSNLDTTRELHARLENALEQVETGLEAVLRALHGRQPDALKMVVVKDLTDQFQSIAEGCRDAGHRVLQIVLKYA